MVKNEIEDVIGIDASYAPLISAKSGLGIEEVLEKIVQYLPCPSGDEDAPLRALIFDSKFDPYKGVILSCRVREGKVRLGEKIRVMHTGKEFVVNELGYFHPEEYVPPDKLQAGEVGYICASIKNVSDTEPGDTVTLADMPAVEPLKG